jgi:CPA2 family monovalent cation:H+ antiporter-2
VAFTISASLAQIGEFSFILVVLGTNLEILPSEARDLVVAGAILSILINPFLFVALEKWLDRHTPPPSPAVQDEGAIPPDSVPVEAATDLQDHVILIGYGQVGSLVANGLRRASIPFLVVEQDSDRIEALRKEGIEAFSGTSGERELLPRLNMQGARVLVSTLPDPFEAGHIVEHARALNPSIRIIARATNTETTAYLKYLGANVVFAGQEEIALRMLSALEDASGSSSQEAVNAP